jgi:hypothetical protein
VAHQCDNAHTSCSVCMPIPCTEQHDAVSSKRVSVSISEG